MTVCVAACVYDGIVFGADSATSIVERTAEGRSIVSNVYNHGNKVFNLRKGFPICAMTAGMGSIGGAPIHALSKDLRKLLSTEGTDYHLNPENYTIQEIATKARNFFFENKYKGMGAELPAPHIFSYWIGGFSSRVEAHELWRITIEDGICAEPMQMCRPGDIGIWCDGQPDPIYRLLKGFDHSLWNALRDAGVEEKELPGLMDMIHERTGRPLLHPAMPIQDAIDLVDFLVDVTKRYYRFLPQADTVGGDTDIAVVTRHENFKWIRRKHFYAAHLNPRETDHA
jgi:hypothetical protein